MGRDVKRNLCLFPHLFSVSVGFLGSSFIESQGVYERLARGVRQPFGGDPGGRLRLTAGSQVAGRNSVRKGALGGARATTFGDTGGDASFGAPCRLMDFSRGQMLPAGGICDAWKNSLEGAVGYCGVWAPIVRVPGIGNIRPRAIAFQGQGGFAGDDLQRR